MNINDFDYRLPEKLIAQFPADKRENSRLMVLDRKTGSIQHRHFYNIVDYLEPGDCLVLNDSRVIPARLNGFKETTGARIEFLLLKRMEGDLWETMVRPGKKLHPGDWVVFSDEPKLKAVIREYGTDGTRIVEFSYDGQFLECLEKVGKMPLPPYIERDSGAMDSERYQTVYGRAEGSVAAPTAGLHFTEELLSKAAEKGVKLAYVTLHVGIGTFRPVKCENIEDHKMHFEEYEVSQETAGTINQTKASGGRIIAVGTTSARTLESAADENGIVLAGERDTDIFIYPGRKFKVVDCLITNFHLPKSTLLMLISAFYQREKILEAYETAVSMEYRFFSYGDAMLII